MLYHAFKTRFISIHSGFLLAVIVFASGLPQSAFAQTCKILVMGDSLSAGYGLSRGEGWVSLMETRIAQKFPRCSIINASISGETTSGGKTRLPALLTEHKPSHMLLELGGNDGLRGLSINAMEENLNDMVRMARQHRTQTILLGMQVPPNYGPAYSEKFKRVYQNLAKQEKLPLVPFFLEGFAQDPNAFQPDGIHPNAKAQSKMLNNVWPVLEKTLK